MKTQSHKRTKKKNAPHREIVPFRSMADIRTLSQEASGSSNFANLKGRTWPFGCWGLDLADFPAIAARHRRRGPSEESRFPTALRDDSPRLPLLFHPGMEINRLPEQAPHFSFNIDGRRGPLPAIGFSTADRISGERWWRCSRVRVGGGDDLLIWAKMATSEMALIGRGSQIQLGPD